MGYFGAITVVCTVPFFIVQKHRPGQQLPEGTSWWSVGFKCVSLMLNCDTSANTNRQIWSAMKSAKDLRQCMLYLLAFFMLQESKYKKQTLPIRDSYINYNLAFGTYFQITGILQNEYVLFILRMRLRIGF